MSLLRILLVEDDPDGLKILGKLLRINGHEVHAAASVSEAVGLARRWRYDLLIADIGLPDGTAMDLMGELHESYGLPGIVVTAHGGAEYRARSRAAGFGKHLLKPIQFDELSAAVAEVRKHLVHQKTQPLRRRSPRIGAELAN